MPMPAYTQAFGTPAQLNKPARVTMQVAALVQARMLAEIEVLAAKARTSATPLASPIR